MKCTHPDINRQAIKRIYVIYSPFHSFAEKASVLSSEALWSNIIGAILQRHHEAERVPNPDHPRPIWMLRIDGFHFFYQVLSTSIAIGDVVSTSSTSSFEPSQDLLAEFTAEEAL